MVMNYKGYPNPIALLGLMSKFLAHVGRIEEYNQYQDAQEGNTSVRCMSADQVHDIYINNDVICSWMYEKAADRYGVSCFDLLSKDCAGSGMDALVDIPYHVVGRCIHNRYQYLDWLVQAVASHTHTAGTPSKSEPKEITAN